MPSARRLFRAVCHRGMSPTTRAALVRNELTRRVRPRPTYALPMADVTVYLSRDDYEIDWASLAFVAVDDAYAGDYDDAVVVDIGAHKGYYGAYALARGARAVVSYEPEAANFALLDRAAASARARDGDWDARRCAVGASSGEAELHVMGASWGHALHPPEEFAVHEVGIERVPVEALGDVLAAATVAADGARVIVKMNIEGEECPTILGTAASAWAGIDEVYVETHPWATCGPDALAQHLAFAGLSRDASAHPAVLRLRRGASRSARRTGPT
jgi:FkbM family methyltransferase